MRKSLFLSTTLLAGGLAVASPALAQESDAAEQIDTSEIIVTGVFSAKTIESAPISINVVTAEQLSEQNPVSAADLLKNVPGVFVNSSLGEIRNVVFSRGVSANSLDGAGGYYYVSLQEDGLPVDIVTGLNYGPDYYLRPDVSLARLEGLRGGTAAVTGPNAPGGIFNYLSKNGKRNPGVELRARYGLQGDGELPQYRADAYFGGALSDEVYYSIGGFYRTDDGTHDAGYTLNEGGQVKANLLYDYAGGSLMVTGKYLDDRNTWNEFTPAIGGKTIAPGFSNVTSNLQPQDGSHCYPIVGGGTDCWDPTGLVHNKALAFGAQWTQDLGGTFKLDNKMRWSHHKSDWNAGAVLSVVSLQDPIVNIIMGTAILSPGTLNYYQGDTLVASMQVNDNGAPPDVPPAFIPGYFTVTQNDLPNQDVLADSGIQGDIGSYVGFANSQQSQSKQFVDQLTVTGEVGDHSLAFGAFFGRARLTTDMSRAAGVGLMTFEPQPKMLTVTYTPDGDDQPTYQVTDPTGFGAYGQPALTGYTGTQQQFSLFFGDSWQLTDKLIFELGGRWESVRYKIDNQLWDGNPLAAVPQYNFEGGADEDLLTLYDNGISTPGDVLRTIRKFDYFNYSLALDYEFSPELTTYVRFTNGKKAPDFTGIQNINTAFRVATEYPNPQKIQQLELGVKYANGPVNVQLFPFYSLLKNVSTSAVFTYENGQQYFTPAIPGEIETYGIEIAASAAVTPRLVLDANVTLQDPTAKGFGTWTQGPSQDGSDDVFTELPSADADNNPKVILRANANWNPVDPLRLFGTVSYLGKRAANAANAFYLPGFTTVDLGAAYDITPNVTFQFNVNNVFDEVGIMSWSRTGFLASLDRQGLTSDGYNPDAIYPVATSQARSYFWTLTAKF